MTKTQIQNKIVADLPKTTHGLLLLSPRIGKTRIAINLIKRDKPKSILWVTPNAKLRDIDIPDEFIQWKAKVYLKKCTLVCYASLDNQIGTYDTVVLDEFQDISVLNSMGLFNGNIKYNNIIGLSGTMPKHEEKLEIYKKLNLKPLVDMSIDQAVEANMIAPYEITVIETRLNSTEKNITAGKKGSEFLQSEQGSYDYLTRTINQMQYSGRTVPVFMYLNRMRFIYNLKSKHEFAKKFINGLVGNTLIFTSTIAQAEELSDNTYHSKTTDDKLKLFLDNKIDRLACVNAGGVGFTYRNIQNFVITQCDSDMKGNTVQKICRGLVLQKGYVANIYILCCINTVDESWKNKVLANFNKDKIKHVSYLNYGS